MKYRKVVYAAIILCLIFIVLPIIGEGFIAGTLVKTPQDSIAIENLRIGDPIFRCNERCWISVSGNSKRGKNPAQLMGKKL